VNEIHNETLCPVPKLTSSPLQQSRELENLVEDYRNQNSQDCTISELMNVVQNIGHVMMNGKFKS